MIAVWYKMKGFQIDLLYYSIEQLAFDSFRRQYVIYKKEKDEKLQREIEARKKQMNK